jgi:hypothetical protein
VRAGRVVAADAGLGRTAEEEAVREEVRMRAGRRVDDRVRAVDDLELVLPPLRPLGALVLAVADLDRLRLERLLGASGVEDELDHLPVALVQVVPVVEGVVEPVLEREPVGVGGLLRDVGVDGRLGVRGDPARPQLVVAAGVESIPGEVEVVLVETATEVVGGRPDLDEVVAAPGAAERDGLLVEDRFDVDRPVRLAGPALLGLLDEADDRRVALGQLLLRLGLRNAREDESEAEGACCEGGPHPGDYALPDGRQA